MQQNPLTKEHQLRIARKTLRMSDIAVYIVGDMTKKEAGQILAQNRIKKH